MNTFVLTKHAAMRIAQRSMKIEDAELIALIGTQVDDGYLVRMKDFQRIEAEFKKLLLRLRRIVGKRLILNNDKVVTAYHASRRLHRRLVRGAYGSDLYD